MKRYVFIGSVDASAYWLKGLLEIGVNIVGIMCPTKEAASLNTNYADLGIVSRDFGKETNYFNNIKETRDQIREMAPDIIFVLGLSQIVPREILEIPAIGCIGSHPAMLPKNRGRHPIIWAIASGLKKSGITLFWLDEKADAGDIWAQEEFSIEDHEDAKDIYEKVKKITMELLRKNIPDLEKGIIRRVKQDDGLATYWRKRSFIDGQIDWRMSSKRIYDLVRALTRPYAGAHFIYKGKEVKVWKSGLADYSDGDASAEPGKVIGISNPRFCVKTGDAAIEILEHDAVAIPNKGEYL